MSYKFNIVPPRLFRILPSSVVAFLALLSQGFAAKDVTLAWDASTDINLSGYRLKYGTSSGSYSQSIDVGKTTTATVPSLAEGSTYYFAVTALNTASLESLPSNEVAFTLAANQPPAVTLTSPTNGASVIVPGTVTLAANASDSDGSIAKVEFYNGTTKIGEDTTSPYSYDYAVSSAGTYSFKAVAVDNLGASTQSTAVTVNAAANQPPSVTMTSPANGTSVVAPATVTLAANALDSDGTVAKVEFYNGATKIGEDTTSPYGYNYSLSSAGTYAFSARATDNRGATSQSAAVSVTVTIPPPVVKNPDVSGVTYTPGTGVQLTVTGTAGQSQSIYASADLKTWTLLSTTTNTTGTVSISDPAAANLTQRFYRVSDGTLTSDPVGFTKLRIAGRTGSQTVAYSYLGVNMVSPASYQGTVTSKGAGSIVDAQADWTDNQFNGANGEFYLEIVSGPMAGLTADIVGTTAATKTLTTDEDLSSVLTGGEKFKIRKHRSIGDVFGKNNEAGLRANTAVSSSDEVRIFNPVTQAFLTYYYNSGSIGWRSSTNAVSDASDTKLYADQGVCIARKITGDLTLVVTGAVKTGPTVIPIGTNSNLTANVYPAGTLTLGNSGLYTGNAATGLAAAGKLSNADEVQIWSGSSFRRYFYKNSGSGGIGWRISSNLRTDASSTQIPAGSSIYVIRRKGRAAFNWKVQQPF